MTEIASFEEFWPYYVKQHQKKATRIVHFLGTTAAGACVLGGLVTKRRWLLAVAPVVGYGPAWLSHFLIEKNKPATFSNPLWSLRADLKMWWMTATFAMDAEVARVLATDAPPADARDASEPHDDATPNAAPTHGNVN